MKPAPMKPNQAPAPAAGAGGDPAPGDAAALASIIEANRAVLKKGWEELDRLTRLLNALREREKHPGESTSKSAPTAGAGPAKVKTTS
jgi:hypothetical protein